MFAHVPNALTGLRLLLAFVFFTLLSFYQYEGRGYPTLLNTAFVIYIVALITDFLDGYLARRWHVEGTFGRIVDPFVDKVLVLGSFAFFAGKNFIIPDPEFPGPHMVVKTISGVTPAMVVILLARELLVTSLRGEAESTGYNFGAEWSGKIKMVIQSATILIILVYVNYLPWLDARHYEPAARRTRDAFIYLTLIVTVLSGLAYIRTATRLYRGKGIKDHSETTST